VNTLDPYTPEKLVAFKQAALLVEAKQGALSAATQVWNGSAKRAPRPGKASR
jgi:hypothetical protein